MDKLKKAEAYYKKGKLANKLVESQLKQDDSLTLYGARAVNMQVPKHLQKPTEDWDIYSEGDPKQEANELEKLLDKKYGADYFAVKPARFPDTFKVYSKITGAGLADIQLEKTDVPTKRIAGINVATLDYQVERIKETLKNPERKFRWDKDKESLQRIKIAQAHKAPKHKPKRRIATLSDMENVSLKKKQMPIIRQGKKSHQVRLINPLYGYYLGRKLLPPDLSGALR